MYSNTKAKPHDTIALIQPVKEPEHLANHCRRGTLLMDLGWSTSATAAANNSSTIECKWINLFTVLLLLILVDFTIARCLLYLVFIKATNARVERQLNTPNEENKRIVGRCSCCTIRY